MKYLLIILLLFTVSCRKSIYYALPDSRDNGIIIAKDMIELYTFGRDWGDSLLLRTILIFPERNRKSYNIHDINVEFNHQKVIPKEITVLYKNYNMDDGEDSLKYFTDVSSLMKFVNSSDSLRRVDIEAMIPISVYNLERVIDYRIGLKFYKEGMVMKVDTLVQLHRRTERFFGHM
ncbi:MAG: hypothetical protein K1X91_04775 [Bacteriodetes bacterium]|nr:hypothetical protein [Bacteroidota bacterium]